MSRARLLWAALLALASGCATDTRPVAGVPARVIAERIAAPAAQGDGALLLAIERAESDGRATLIAHDVARNAVRFTADVEDAASAAALGDVVWVQAGSAVRALDAASGHELYRLALPEGRYAGAARAADRIAYASVSGRALDPNARTVLTIVDARSGARTGALELPGDAGRPVGADGLAFVPSQRQRIIAVDVARGQEVARLRAESDAIEWLGMRRDAQGASTLLFGGRGFHRLVAGDAQPSASFRLPDALTALPGRPSAPESAYEDARGRRIGLYVTPALGSGSDVALLAGRAYFVFYSQLFAFDAQGALVYAKGLGADVIAARVLDEGLSVATARGELLLLSHASGAVLATQALTVSAAGLRSAELPERAPQPVASDASAPPSADALARTLLELAGAEDSRLVPARSFAVSKLASMEEPAITGELLALYERPNTPAELQSALAAALSTRRTGLSALTAALERRYDFLTGARPAPLSIIAPALARGGEKAAVPGLLARLWDHETPVTALPSLARALAALGDRETAAPLLDWLRLYHADSSLRAQPEALIEVARAAHALDAEHARSAIAELLERHQLAEAPARELAALIAPPQAQREPVPAAVVQAPPPVLPRLPAQRAIDAAFAAQLEAIKPCIDAELQKNPKLLQLRIAFIAEGDGSAHGFHFAPASGELTDCLYPKVASVRLPAFAEPRAVEQVTINLRAPSAAPLEAASSANEPWWAWRMHATREKTSATPWWHIEQLVPPRLDESAGSALEIEAGVRPAVIAAPAPTPAPAPAPTAAPATAPKPSPAPAEEQPDQWWLPAQP